MGYAETLERLCGEGYSSRDAAMYASNGIVPQWSEDEWEEAQEEQENETDTEDV